MFPTASVTAAWNSTPPACIPARFARTRWPSVNILAFCARHRNFATRFADSSTESEIAARPNQQFLAASTIRCCLEQGLGDCEVEYVTESRVQLTLSVIASLENEKSTREASPVPDEPEIPQVTIENNDFAERRLWFDYLSKLNDRALNRRALQPTSWVLVGLLAAIVYRVVPQVPGYLNTPNAVRQGLVVLALGADTVIALTFAAAFVLEYCSGNRKGRVLAERNRRSHWISLTQMTLAIALLGALHLWLLHRFLGPSITRWSTGVFGVLWSMSALSYGLFLATKGYKAAKLHLKDLYLFSVWAHSFSDA